MYVFSSWYIGILYEFLIAYCILHPYMSLQFWNSLDPYKPSVSDSHSASIWYPLALVLWGYRSNRALNDDLAKTEDISIKLSSIALLGFLVSYISSYITAKFHFCCRYPREVLGLEFLGTSSFSYHYEYWIGRQAGPVSL